MRVFIFSNLLPEFPYKSFIMTVILKITQPQVLSYWAWAACDFTPTAGRLTPARRWPWYHGFSTPTMFEHGRPWFDRGVWPWCVISPWPWYIANHNGNKVNYCFLLSQWKHITAHNNNIFSNKLLEMHWVKATPNHGRPSPILSPTQLQSNPTNTDIEGTERRVRIREVSV